MKPTRNCLRGRILRNGVGIATAANVALIGLGSLAIAQESPPYYGPQMMWGGGWYGMIFGPVFMVLVLAGVIALVALLVRWLGGPWYGAQPPHETPASRMPVDILKERFARGEIDKNEFEERRRVLGD